MLFLLVALLNPFNIVQWSEQRSHELWQNIYAHCYEASAPGRAFPCLRSDLPPDPRPRDATTVFYMDHASLSRMGLSRPISPFELQGLIDDISYAGGDHPPLAIFVDLLLTDAAPKGWSAQALLDRVFVEPQASQERARCAKFTPGDTSTSPFRCLLARVGELTRYDKWGDRRRCQESTLAKLACIRGAGGLPLLFADPRPRDEGRVAPGSVSSGLDALGQVAATVPVALAPDRYDLALPASAALREHQPFALTPVAALYALWCADMRRCAQDPVVRDDLGRPAWRGTFDKPVDVIWAIGTRNAFNMAIERQLGGRFGRDCREARRGIGATSLHLARLTVMGIKWAEKPPCPYANAAPIDVLQTTISAADSAALVSNKIVMLGGQFGDSNDAIPAAPFGTVAGVYYHAMALDNLIARGTAYPQPVSTISDGLTLTDGDLGSFLLLILVASLIEMARKALREPGFPLRNRTPSRRLEVARRAGIVLVFGLAIIAMPITVTGDWVVIPDSFNLVAAVMLGIIGLGELLWDAFAPIHERLRERLSAHRLWKHIASDEPESKSESESESESGHITPSREEGKSHEEPAASAVAGRHGAGSTQGDEVPA